MIDHRNNPKTGVRFSLRCSAEFGVSREVALTRLRRNSDSLAARQREDAAATIRRYEERERRCRHLADATALFRSFVALGDPDWRIVAARTGDAYRMAQSVTADGVVLAAVGFNFGWAFGAGAHGAVRTGRARSSRRQVRGA